MDSEILGAIIAALAAILSAIIGGLFAIKIKDMELKSKEDKTGVFVTEAERKSSHWVWGIGGAIIGVIVVFLILFFINGSSIFPSPEPTAIVNETNAPSPISIKEPSETNDDPTNTPIPDSTSTPTSTPKPRPSTNTPKPTSTSTPFPTRIPTPNIPIYDDFEDGVVKDSWYDPKWEGDHNLEFEFTENNGALQLHAKNTTDIDRLGKLLLSDYYGLQKFYALITLEDVKNGQFGLYVGTPSNWYNIFIRDDVIFLDSSQGVKKTAINRNCCPSTHLLGIETDGQEIYFYVDGKLLASLPENESIDFSGFEISAGRNGGEVSTSISDVWVQ